MKALNLCLTVFALPWLAAAFPSDTEPPPSAPLGGELITDPSQAIDKQRHGKQTPIRIEDIENHSGQGDHLEKRIFVLFGLAGAAIIEAGGAALGVLAGLAGQLAALFLQEDVEIWEDKRRCRADFETWAGWDGRFNNWARDKSGSDGDIFNYNIAWKNPPTTEPPTHYFENAQFGRYSVQFTDTDRGKWDGIPETEPCYPGFQGICNPQYIFYRRGYVIVLNTWKSQGVKADCQYLGTEKCGGLCKSGIRDQSHAGGMVWGGRCAVPCRDEGSDVPVDQPKMMVVGDSISHGMEDDFTWRWRLFYWVREVACRNVQFVGPWIGTHGPVLASATRPMPPLFPGEAPTEDQSGIYGRYHELVPGYFKSHRHASKWGRQVAQTKDTIKQWVLDHQPDYLLVLLGFNDLGWWVSGPDDLVGNMGILVENARQAKPNIKILIGNVVHRTFIIGRQDQVDNTNRYNTLLRQRMDSWFRWESPLVYVDVNANYNCRPEHINSCPDAYDGLHPNAMGEYHIAEAVARALKKHFGFLGPDLAVPANPEARNVGTSSHPEGLQTSWDIVRYSRGYDIRARLQGMSDWWSEGPVSPNSYASWNTWVLLGQTWEFQVRTRGDGSAASGWSRLSSATANVQTAQGPSDIVAVPVGADGLQISWSAVGGYSVNRYSVIIWDKDTPGAFIEARPTTGTSMYIGGLKRGNKYATWVATYINLNGRICGGLPSSGREVYIDRGQPGVPGGLMVVNLDPTTVRLDWNPVGGASGYGVYIFRVATARLLAPTRIAMGSCGLRRGIIGIVCRRFNGNLESERACVVADVYPGWKKRDAVVPGNGTASFGNGTTGGSGVYDSKAMIADESLRALLGQMMIQEATVGNETVAVLGDEVFGI